MYNYAQISREPSASFENSRNASHKELGFHQLNFLYRFAHKFKSFATT